MSRWALSVPAVVLGARSACMFDFNATKKRIIDERWPHHRDSSPDYPDSSWSEGQLGWKVALHRYSVFEHMIEIRGSRNPAKLGSDWLSFVTNVCYRHRNSIVCSKTLYREDCLKSRHGGNNQFPPMRLNFA